MRYPWTEAQWQVLQQRRTRGQLPHAILLAGPAGLGKHEFARDLAQGLLCDQPTADGRACQQCRACHQFSAGTHPDILPVSPEDPGKAIKVDQIRALIEQFGFSSHQGGYRVAIISPAEQMNLNAANSLLKTLEEPPGQSLLLLVSAQPARLPATILSRCQRMEFACPPHAQALDWLKNTQSVPAGQAEGLLALAHGAPLAALAMAADDVLAQRHQLFDSLLEVAAGRQGALTASAPWLKLALPTPINWLYSWVGDLIRLKCSTRSALTNHDLADGLQKLARQVDLGELYRFLDELTAVLRMPHTALNMQMLMEGLLLNWERMTCGQTGKG